MGRKKYYRNNPHTICGEACSLETWHESRNMFSNNRYSRLTHLATATKFDGFSKTSYYDAEAEAKNAATQWMQQRQQQNKIAAQAKQLAELQAAQERQRLEHERKLQEMQRQQKLQTKRTLTQQKLLLDSQLNEKQAQYDNEGGVGQALADLRLKINVEQKEMDGNHFGTERNDSNSKIAVLIGNTGGGKSSVANRLTGDSSMMADEGPFRTSDSCQSCTQSLQKVRAQIGSGNVWVTIVDAPGFNDSIGNDRTHANNLCAYLKGCGGINNFVLVRNASNYRFDDNLNSMLEKYQTMFGVETFWSNLIIVLTRVEKGFPELQFKQANKVQDIRNYIRTKYGLSATDARFKLPIIPIGLDNYEGKSQQFVDCLSANKFECQEMKSPLDELLILQQQLVLKSVQELRKIEHIRNQIEAVQNQINAV